MKDSKRQPGPGRSSIPASPPPDAAWTRWCGTSSAIPTTLKAEGANAFAFETYDPPGTFVPPHVHPTQDEFIFVLENEFDLYLDGQHHKARMPATWCACRPASRTATTT